MNSRNLLLLGVILLLVVGGFFLLNKNSNNSQKEVTVSSSPASTSTSSPKTESKITVTTNGFEPQTLKIKAGTTVVWENKSGETANISSDPHPIHTNWPFLNLGNFEDGGSVSVKFDKVGVYTYHNHLNPTQTGTIIVE